MAHITSNLIGTVQFKLSTRHECAKPSLTYMSYLQMFDKVAQLLLQCIGALFAVVACHQPPERPLGEFILYKLYAVPEDLPASEPTVLTAVL